MPSRAHAPDPEGVDGDEADGASCDRLKVSRGTGLPVRMDSSSSNGSTVALRAIEPGTPVLVHQVLRTGAITLGKPQAEAGSYPWAQESRNPGQRTALATPRAMRLLSGRPEAILALIPQGG
jgi:hypothetical protein